MFQKELKDLKYLVDDISQMVCGKKGSEREVDFVKESVLTLICSNDRRNVEMAKKHLRDTFITMPYVRVEIGSGIYEDRKTDVARVYIGIQGYTNYDAYVGFVPARQLNVNGLFFANGINDDSDDEDSLLI